MANPAAMFAMKIVLVTAVQLSLANDQLMADLSTASSSFSQRLYKNLGQSKPNLIYSPYSIHSALTMTSTGARGDTQQEMKDVLGLTSMSDTNVRRAYHNLIVKLNSAQRVKLDTANALFTNPSFKIKDQFVNQVAADFFATADNFDLAAQAGPEAAVNDYVSLKTHKMITKVLEPGSIDSSTLMLLVNTIFFNGTWAHPFDKFKTRKQDFTQLGNAKQQVDMMHQEGYVLYKSDSNRKVDVLELPFEGGRFGLFLALPHQTEGIGQLEDSLVGGVDDLFQNMVQNQVSMAIPKFKIETSLGLKRVLTDMGMIKAFSGKADFSGMSEQGSFHIDDVIHKAVIDVTESGTTAAAVTVVHMRLTMAVIFMPPTTQFIADHPFMYFLRDKQTGQILFQGKYSG